MRGFINEIYMFFFGIKEKVYFVRKNKSLLQIDLYNCIFLKFIFIYFLIFYYLEYYYGSNRDVKLNCRFNENRNEIIFWSEINKLE